MDERPKSPSCCCVLIDPDTGGPVDASKRSFLKTGMKVVATIGWAAGVASSAFTLVGYLDDKKQRMQDAMQKDLFKPDADVRRKLLDVFPFLDELGNVRFFPNTDNKLLVPDGIGDGAASIADHLRLHTKSVSATLDFAYESSKPVRIHREALRLFSYQTLAQSRFLFAA